LIKFTQNLTIGIDEIDEQHKTFFDLFNSLYDSIHQNTGETTAEQAFSFLKDYVYFHFRTEEWYMEKYSYPEYESHKVQHEHFIEQLEQKQQDFLLADDAMGLEILDWLSVWFRSHIFSTDVSMGEFFRQKREKAQSSP